VDENYTVLHALFDYYSPRSGEGSQFHVDADAFQALLADFALVRDDKPGCDAGAARLVFAECNVQSDPRDPATKLANHPAALMRFELIECFIRLAICHFGNGEVTPGPVGRAPPPHPARRLSECLEGASEVTIQDHFFLEPPHSRRRRKAVSGPLGCKLVTDEGLRILSSRAGLTRFVPLPPSNRKRRWRRWRRCWPSTCGPS
jgi:hypothetical protein